MINKVLLAGTRQLSAEVLFGDYLCMLHHPGREHQNYVAIILMLITELLMQILVLRVYPLEMGPRSTGTRLPT